MRKKRLQETSSFTFSVRIFHVCFININLNHTGFLVQFGINFHLWVFPKAHLCKLIPNWTRNRMITYTNTQKLWGQKHKLELEWIDRCRSRSQWHYKIPVEKAPQNKTQRRTQEDVLRTCYTLLLKMKSASIVLLQTSWS